MKIAVRIENLYSEEVWLLEGTRSQVEAAILLRVPWLRSPDPADRGDLAALLEHLNAQQAFVAWVVSERDAA